MAKELGEGFDPRALLGLLNIANPVLWVEAGDLAGTPSCGVRDVAGAVAAAPAGGTGIRRRPQSGGAGNEAEGERRVPLPLTRRAGGVPGVLRLSLYQPLAEQLAEIAYKRSYLFGGELASTAGSLLLALVVSSGTRCRCVSAPAKSHRFRCSRVWAPPDRTCYARVGQRTAHAR
ncbi:hypothetical protein [Plantactinospora alkalitolerans]|uniref:hypothetical protein n=1 Tax=Plantactinospora alkalitolerans TaxID=2789879 RepID=UPI0018ACC5F4|nr:hypothetical protein [Plantactinospora alkalitolerans]